MSAKQRGNNRGVSENRVPKTEYEITQQAQQRESNRFNRENYRGGRDNRDRNGKRDNRPNEKEDIGVNSVNMVQNTENLDGNKIVNRRRNSDNRNTDSAKTRPKLNLAPRTIPLTDMPDNDQAAKTSIFGEAKPVDTSQRERQIEERLAKEQEQIRKKDDRVAMKSAGRQRSAGLGPKGETVRPREVREPPRRNFLEDKAFHRPG